MISRLHHAPMPCAALPLCESCTRRNSAKSSLGWAVLSSVIAGAVVEDAIVEHIFSDF